ncbi:MAG: hypothetical protein V4469_03560 [Patescibacteria group bacterium]
MKRNQHLPADMKVRTEPLLHVVPKTAKGLVDYQILLASSGKNRRNREHLFTDTTGGVLALCNDPAYNKMAEKESKADPKKVIGAPEILLKLEHRGDNRFMLTIAESELLPPGEVSSQLHELEKQDAQLPRKEAA